MRIKEGGLGNRVQVHLPLKERLQKSLKKTGGKRRREAGKRPSQREKERGDPLSLDEFIPLESAYRGRKT